MKEHFLLDPQVIFLNHGSFGATPKPVFEQYQTWQLELERQPVEFIGRRSKELLHQARIALAQYFHTEADNLVYMTNVTVAVNAVARSLKLTSGDEVLTTNQEYGALDRTWRFLEQKEGFKYINVPLQLPVTTPEQYVKEFWAGVTTRTRVIFISHISSPTSVIAPVKEICRLARAQGILTVIDGAHVPGHIPLNLEDIGADFYGGNLHKWLCAPKGAGFLYASPPVHHLLEPLTVSYGWESDAPSSSRLVDLYEYIGTRDLSAFLSVPAAIDFQAQQHWDTHRARAHALATECMLEITRLTGQVPLYPAGSDWYAQMVTVPLPSNTNLNALKENLYNQYHIEVPMILWNNRPMVRVSFQAYNSHQDLEALLAALRSLLYPEQVIIEE